MRFGSVPLRKFHLREFVASQKPAAAAAVRPKAALFAYRKLLHDTDNETVALEFSESPDRKDECISG